MDYQTLPPLLNSEKGTFSVPFFGYPFNIREVLIIADFTRQDPRIVQE
jgi:hypothetical protein